MKFDKEKFETLDPEEQKDLLVSFGKYLFSLEKRFIVQKDFENRGITYSKITELFGNLQNLKDCCGIPRSSRMRGMTDDELKKYILSITIVGHASNINHRKPESVCFSNCDCWITEKLSNFVATKRPSIHYKGKRMRLARLVYLLFIGPLDPKLCIMHECDNESCYNPAHLKQGTYKQNAVSMVARGRHNNGVKKFINHELRDPYDTQKLLNLVKSRCIISYNNEWLYTGNTHSDGYPRININYKEYVLSRLILANKLKIKYEDVKYACHKFTEENLFDKQPKKHDVNPDHLYNGTLSQNSRDTAYYAKNKLHPSKLDSIRKAVEETDFSKISTKDFDLELAQKFQISALTISGIRTGRAYSDPSTKSHKGRGGSRKKPIVQLDMSSNFINRFDSATDAAKILFGADDGSGISAACNGRLKHFKKFIWKFETDYYCNNIVEIS